MKRHALRLLKAKNAGRLRKSRAKTWDRSISKKQRAKIRCRNRDARKGGWDSARD